MVVRDEELLWLGTLVRGSGEVLMMVKAGGGEGWW